MKKIIILFFIATISNAQTKISLEKAIETALKNNNSIKSEKLKADYAKAMIQSAHDIPKTNIYGGFGQINGLENDNSFGISQSIAFPTVYKRQKQLLTEEWNAKMLSSTLKEREVQNAVNQVFYNYLILKEKEKLLMKADTLFSNFYQKANLRLQKGESNILEKTTAETQKANISMQLKQIQNEIETTKIEFQLLLNTDEKMIPTADKLKLELNPTTFNAENNPIAKLMMQQKKVINAETNLHKSKLLPELNIGYNNISFKGLDDAKRFHSAQIGLGIPVFGGSQKAKIEASKIAENWAENEYQSQLLILKSDYNKRLTQYQSNLEMVNYFETNGNKNSKLITETANKQFINGDINYLDFVMLVNQSILVQNNYIETVKMLNESIIAINNLNK